MKKLASVLVVGLSVVALAGCSERERTTFVGATVGGLAASVLGKGQGRMVAIGLGTIAGAMFGQHIGDQLDRAQHKQVDEQMSNSMEYNRDGQASQWQDPNAAVTASTLPLKTYRTAEGRYCREFQQEISIDGETQRAYGTACRQPDGSWEIIS